MVMEVLLECGSSKWECKILENQDVFESLEAAFRQFDLNLSHGISQDEDKKPTHFLQCFSNKWQDFVDVVNKSEICNGYRIKAVAKSEPEEIAIDKVYVSTWCCALPL